MKIYGCQFDIAWENKEANYQRVQALLDREKIAGNSLVVLPEMFATGFSMNAAPIAEPENGPTDHFLRELARKKGAFAIGGLPRRGPRGKFHNEAVCFAPSGRRAASYAKSHPFTLGGESQHYTAGDEIATFRWGKFTVGLSICYDLRFPELTRLLVEKGADLLVVIASWPDKRHHHWTTLLRARAIESQAYVIGVNRCGDDPQHHYAGGSIIVNPWGEILADAGSGETVISADLDPTVVKQWRKDFPALRDIRTSFKLR